MSSNTNQEIDDDTVLELVQSFLLDDVFSDQCEKFGRENASLFDPDSDENKLEYTTKYNEFCEQFESHIEKFIQENGVPLEKFYEIIQRENEENGANGVTGFMIALQDFDVFLSMMKDIAREERANQQ